MGLALGFFDSFTGKKQARDLQNAYNDSERYLGGGRDRARADYERYGNEARGYLDPFREGGLQANRLYHDALGINGADAQRAFYAGFQNDPGFQAELQAGIGALDKAAAARGGMYGGNQMKALHQYGLQQQRGAFQNRLAHLAGAGGQGMQAAGQQAGLTMGMGQQLGDLEWGYGQQQANNRINIGNALAQSRNIGWNNLLKMGELATKAYAGGK